MKDLFTETLFQIWVLLSKDVLLVHEENNNRCFFGHHYLYWMDRLV